MEDCLFCKFCSGEIPVEKLFENDKFFVIRDINPQAPVHLLCITKHHFKLFSQMNEQDKNDIGEILFEIAQHQKEWGLDNGYRIAVNQGDDAGQTVPHLHIHVFGGKELKWEKL